MMGAGIVYLITFWYPVEEHSLRIAVVLPSATAAGIFGGCIAYVVGHLNGESGLEGSASSSLVKAMSPLLPCL